MYSINSLSYDSNGFIYIGIDEFSRIQVYNSDYEFIRGWFIDTDGGGGWKFRIDDSDVLHTLGSGMYSRYSIMGDLLEKEYVYADTKRYYDVRKTRRYNLFEDLTISRDIVYNFVIRSHSTPEIVIKTKWYLMFFNFPTPFILYAIFFVIYAFYRALMSSRDKKKC